MCLLPAPWTGRRPRLVSLLYISNPSKFSFFLFSETADVTLPSIYPLMNPTRSLVPGKCVSKHPVPQRLDLCVCETEISSCRQAPSREYKFVPQTKCPGHMIASGDQPQHVSFALPGGKYLQVSNVSEQNCWKLPDGDAVAFSASEIPAIIHIRMEVNGHTNFNNVLIA